VPSQLAQSVLISLMRLRIMQKRPRARRGQMNQFKALRWPAGCTAGRALLMPPAQQDRRDFAYPFFSAGTGVPAILRFTDPRKRALVK
jgi:hypothetical protein